MQSSSSQDKVTKLVMPWAVYHFRTVLTVYLHQGKPFSSLKDTLINNKQVAMWTAHDPVLSRVRHMVENGWSHDIRGELAPYKHQEMELGVVRYLLCMGEQSCDTNSCMARSKHWNCCMKDIWACQEWRQKPVGWCGGWKLIQILKRWSNCEVSANSHITIQHLFCVSHGISLQNCRKDFTWTMQGLSWGKCSLIVVDSYSKWIDAEIVTSASSALTVKKVEEVICHFWVASHSHVGQWSCICWGRVWNFREEKWHSTQPHYPYHPASNRQVESVVPLWRKDWSKLVKELWKLYSTMWNTRVTWTSFAYSPGPIASRSAHVWMCRLNKSVKFQIVIREPGIDNLRWKTWFMWGTYHPNLPGFLGLSLELEDFKLTLLNWIQEWWCVTT